MEISKAEALKMHKEVVRNLSYLFKRREQLPNNRAIESAIELSIVTRSKLAEILDAQ